MIRLICSSAEMFPVNVCYRVRCFTFHLLEESTIRIWLNEHRHSAVGKSTVWDFRRKAVVETTVEQTVRVEPDGFLSEKDREDLPYRQSEDDPYDYEQPLNDLLWDMWSRPLITPETEKYEGDLNVLSIQPKSIRNLKTHPYRWRYSRKAHQFSFGGGG